MMRTFVISDLHGNNDLFRRSLKAVALKKTDKLFILGDLIDRGNDSKGVLDTVLLLREHGFTVECLLGNHEQMLLDAFKNSENFNLWMLNGGDRTLVSFLTSSLEKIPIKYIDLIKSFKYFFEYKNYILVHAGLNMKKKNPFDDIHTILWERNPESLLDSNWLKNRFLIHGHTPMPKDNIIQSITDKNKIICIDNGVYLKKQGFGKLCILELENLKLNFIP